MRVSPKGKALIKAHEGCRLKAYLCPAGVWTIGYGSTGPHVTKGKVISKQEAEELLDQDLVRFEKAVLIAVRPAVPNQSEFDAMVSLAFNIGTGAFARSSVAKNFKLGNKAKAAASFGMWTKARNPRTNVLEPLPGLVRRRAEEKQLFLEGANQRTVQRFTSPNKATVVPEGSVVPEEPKSLAKSREIIGGGVVGTGGVLQLVSQFSITDATSLKAGVQEVKGDASQGFMAQMHIPEIASFLVVVLSVFIIWKRFKDRKEGIR